MFKKKKKGQKVKKGKKLRTAKCQCTEKVEKKTMTMVISVFCQVLTKHSPDIKKKHSKQ